jgi:hypothetical protein
MAPAKVSAPVATPVVLNKDAESYDHREIFVRGYVHLTPSSHIIYQSQSLFRKFSRYISTGVDFEPRDFFKYCLTIANPAPLYKLRRAFDGKTLTLKGRFLAHYKGDRDIDLGSCPNPTAVVIDERALTVSLHQD